MDEHGGSAADWGDPDPDDTGFTTSAGPWSAVATSHGLESLSFGGQRIATRVFFTVRDLVWGSPRVTFSYTGSLADESGLGFTCSVDGAPLEVVGRVAAAGTTLQATFTVTALAATSVTRAGPCILHERSDLAPHFSVTGLAGTKQVETADRILIERIATGYSALDLDLAALHVAIGFEGALFEMEDQRNWADSTFKSYCPPLADPQPISLAAGESLDYVVSFVATAIGASSVGTDLVGTGPVASAASAVPLELRDVSDAHPMPRLGLLHSGGRLPEDAAARLKTLRPAYLHLLANLASATWRDDLLADLAAAADLGADAVITVDADPSADDAALAELAALARGRASTVLLFDRGLPTTSDALAAHPGFAAAGIQTGGGTRANFASLNAAGRVPDALEVVAVPLAVASHDDDRRALASSLESFEAIIHDTRQLAGEREVLVGPVTFRPTFDSWGPPDAVRDPFVDWRSTSPRNGTAFEAAWIVAAVGELASHDVHRVTIGSTAIATSPAFEAFRALSALRDRDVWQVRGSDRVLGIRSADDLVLGVMTDNDAALDFGGRVLRVASPHVFSHATSDAAAHPTKA